MKALRIIKVEFVQCCSRMGNIMWKCKVSSRTSFPVVLVNRKEILYVMMPLANDDSWLEHKVG